MPRATNFRTKQGDIDARIAMVMMAFSYDGVRVIDTPMGRRFGTNFPYGKAWRCGGEWIPFPLMRFGGVDNDRETVLGRLANLCKKELLESDTRRYRPPQFPFTFERPIDGAEVLSEVEQGTTLYRWRLSEISLAPADCKMPIPENRKAWNGKLKDCVCAYVLADDGLTTNAIDCFRLTREGTEWAENLLGRNSDGADCSTPAATSDGGAPEQAPEQAPELTPDAGAGGSGAVATNTEALDVEAELALLEKDTPQLDKLDGQWVTTTITAGIEGPVSTSLKKYRYLGRKMPDDSFGIDPAGRTWRRGGGTPKSHIWYYKPSLLKYRGVRLLQNKLAKA